MKEFEEERKKSKMTNAIIVIKIINGTKYDIYIGRNMMYTNYSLLRGVFLLHYDK